jgi:energy-converting hydrogenase Eha subunit G
MESMAARINIVLGITGAQDTGGSVCGTGQAWFTMSRRRAVVAPSAQQREAPSNSAGTPSPAPPR